MAVSLERFWEFGNVPLNPSDDPFNSTQVAPREAWRNCQIIIRSRSILRPGQPTIRMTYEWLHQTLLGLMYYFAIDGRKVKSIIAVEHVDYGVIGTGRVAPLND